MTNCVRFRLKFNEKYDYETGCLSTLEDILHSETWEYCKRQRNKVTSLKRKGVKEFCTYAATASKNPREFWRKMKPLLPSSRSNTQSSITLVENGCVISNPSELAEIFHDHFSNMVQAVQLSAESAEFYYPPKC